MKKNLPRLPAVHPRSRNDIEKMASRLIKAHYPDLLRVPGAFPIDEFAEFICPEVYGFSIGPSDLLSHIEAVTNPKRKVTFLRPDVYDGLLDGDNRARFTTCHELGHLLLHSNVDSDFTASSQVRFFRKEELPPYRDPEWQADNFAGALLMPLPALDVYIAQYGSELNDLARKFHVSTDAAKVRIGILTRTRKLHL